MITPTIINNSSLARIVADITGDGNLQIQGWRYITSFTSKHIEEIHAVNQRFKSAFAVEGKIYVDDRVSVKSPRSGRRYRLCIISKPVALFLKEIGTPVGNKTNIAFSIPSWIIESNSNTKSAYLRGLFDNEGSIFCRNNGRWQMGFRMVKNQNLLEEGKDYLNQIRTLLSEFGVKSSPVRGAPLNIRKDGTQSFELVFNIEKSSFRNFLKHIGFDHPEKREKLLLATSAFVAKRLKRSPAEGQIEGSSPSGRSIYFYYND